MLRTSHAAALPQQQQQQRQQTRRAALPLCRHPRRRRCPAVRVVASASAGASPNNPNPIAPAAVFAALVADASSALARSSAQPLKTCVRAFLSGCYIAMGGLVAVSVVGASPALVSSAPGLARLVFALVFPVGLMLNLAHGGELFTGQTMRATLAVLHSSGDNAGATAQQLLQNWIFSFFGNLAGSLFIVALVVASGLFPIGSPAAAFAASMAQAKMALPFHEAVVRGVLGNVFVCMAVWQASCARTITDRFFAIWPPIASFVACGLEHAIANMMIVPLGLACGGGLDAVSFSRFLTGNLLAVTIGNTIAGAAVVAGLSHAVYGGRDREEK